MYGTGGLVWQDQTSNIAVLLHISTYGSCYPVQFCKLCCKLCNSANIMHPVLPVLNIISCPRRINSKKEKQHIKLQRGLPFNGFLYFSNLKKCRIMFLKTYIIFNSKSLLPQICLEEANQIYRFKYLRWSDLQK